jgi:hypothetical protein
MEDYLTDELLPETGELMPVLYGEAEGGCLLGELHPLNLQEVHIRGEGPAQVIPYTLHSLQACVSDPHSFDTDPNQDPAFLDKYRSGSRVWMTKN